MGLAGLPRGWSRRSVNMAVVTSSPVEAACWVAGADPAAVTTLVSDRNPEVALKQITELCRPGVGGLVSFGVAAGLGPALRPADLVLADRVVLPCGRSVVADRSWREACADRLAAAGRKVVVAAVVGMDTPPASVSAKRRAFCSTCAAVADGESHLVAAAAEARRLPLLVLRAVADPAWEDHLARASERPGALALIARLAARPLDMAATLRFARHERLALEALQIAAGLVPPPGFAAAA